MGLFSKKQKAVKLKVEMHGYENGKEVELKSNPTDEAEIYKNLSVLATVKEQIQPLENIVIGFAVALNQPQRVDDEILLLKSLISSYQDLKRKCYSLGPEFIEYMNKAWDNVRSGKPDGPAYITRFENRLEEIQKNYDAMKSNEERHDENLIGLEPKVISYISETQPVVQSEIYKAFDSSVKNDIRDMMYRLEQDGIIARVKNGKSYLVSLR